MDKQESQNLMIGSWVLAGGEPRQVCKLTKKKAGFKRDTSGHRDFFLFEELQGIPLFEELLSECIKLIPPENECCELKEIKFKGYRCIGFIEKRGHVDALMIYSLHTLQAYLLSRYGCNIEFDLEKYKWAKQPEMVVTKNQMEQLKEMATAPIGKDTPKVVLKESLSKRLKEFGKRVSSVYKHTPLLPSPEKGENGLQEGMLTYKDTEKENPSKLFEPGTLVTIQGTSCVFMSVGVKTNKEIDTFHGFDILTGEPGTRCDGQARLATKKECTLYWSALRRRLSNQKPY